MGTSGAMIFPFTVAPTPIANGTCRVTNIISSSYSFLFLKPSDLFVYSYMLLQDTLQLWLLDWPDFMCFQFEGNASRHLEIVHPLYPKIFVSLFHCKGCAGNSYPKYPWKMSWSKPKITSKLSLYMRCFSILYVILENLWVFLHCSWKLGIWWTHNNCIYYCL